MKFVVRFLLASLAVCSAAALMPDTLPQTVDPLAARNLLSSDFEDGVLSPWYDASPSSTVWTIESWDSPFEEDNPAPEPFSGTKYLRAQRKTVFTSGLAVLSSIVFTALPGDSVAFSFWIRSRHTQGNTLKVTTKHDPFS